MPKRKTVATLQRLCLEHVAENMEDIWVKDYDDTYSVEDEQSYESMGPFHMLVDYFVQELFKLMTKKDRLTSAVLRSLLVPLLAELDLSYCPHQANMSLVRFITVRCKCLSILNLSRCDQIPPNALVDLVKALPSLQRLNLSWTLCDARVLLAVRSHLHKLCDLNISHCERLFPESLLHLAYDPIAGSFCSQALKVLTIGPQGPGENWEDVVWALVFLLLALPNLEVLFHKLLVGAVRLISNQKFDSSQIPPGFPSVGSLVRRRKSSLLSEDSSRFTLGLKSVYELNEKTWRMVSVMCPSMIEASVILRGWPGLDHRLWSLCVLTQLTIRSDQKMDMRALWPVVTNLGPRLKRLSINGFCFVDELSFYGLLCHCLNLRTLNIDYLSPLLCPPENRSHFSPFSWGFHLLPHGFPELREFSLSQSGKKRALPPWHRAMLTEWLELLLKHSPRLSEVELSCLPFDLDQVFVHVMAPPSMALINLSKLVLAGVYVSCVTIRTLLSSQNELCYLKLFLCSDIHEKEHGELLQMIKDRYLDVEIDWE